MRSWALLTLLLVLTSLGAEAKRFDPFMVDPLMRRSPLEKNFMRFGRSLSSFPNPSDSLILDTTPEDHVDIQLTRSLEDPNLSQRYTRGNKENFMRFGRSRNENFMRFGKSKQDNFIRFGRGKYDNFMRFGRGKQDNFMRFGRGKQDNFMRFGRGKQENFMRFGRGKQDNFMRFGRDFEDQVTLLKQKDANSKNELLRDSRGMQDNFMRFGKSFVESADSNIPLSISGILSVPVRDSRTRQNSFVSFGKSYDEEGLPTLDNSFDTMKTNYNTNTLHELKSLPSKRSNLVRAGRQPPSKDDSFIRFGRNSDDENKESSISNELIPQRLKRSVFELNTSEDDDYSKKVRESNTHLLEPLVLLPEYVEDVFSPSEQLENNNRRKRSVSSNLPTSTPTLADKSPLDLVPAKNVHGTSQLPVFQPSLISAGFPNVIIAPEFSLLPNLEPPSTMNSGYRPNNQDFLRLG